MYDSIDLLTSARGHFLKKLLLTKIMHFGVRFQSRNKHDNEKVYFQIDIALMCNALSHKLYDFVTKLANSALDHSEFKHFATSKRLNTGISNNECATKSIKNISFFLPSSVPCLET